MKVKITASRNNPAIAATVLAARHHTTNGRASWTGEDQLHERINVRRMGDSRRSIQGFSMHYPRKAGGVIIRGCP